VPHTYVYCVVEDAAAVPPGLTGVDGTPVRCLEAGAFALWVGDVDATPAPSVARVRAHDRVCAAALTSVGTPIPLRFGQLHADDASARRALESRAGEVSAAFARVRGAVEGSLVLPIRADDARPPGPASTSTSPGRRYLEHVAERYRLERVVHGALGGMIQAIESELSVLAREGARALRAGAPSVVLLSHLLDAGRMDHYRERALELGASWPGGEPAVTGPSAPYSFTSLALEGEGTGR
jgi:hypothetical protein